MMTATIDSSLKEQHNNSQFMTQTRKLVGFVSAESERTPQPEKIILSHNDI